MTLLPEALNEPSTEPSHTPDDEDAQIPSTKLPDLANVSLGDIAEYDRRPLQVIAAHLGQSGIGAATFNAGIAPYSAPR